MTAVELIEHLLKLGATLYIENNELKCKVQRGVLSAELLENLKLKKLEIVEFLKRNTLVEDIDAIELVSRSGRLPLSYAQQRLWFLDQLEPGNSFYNIPASVELRGELNVEALRESFARLVERHESLRTRIRVDEVGEGYQEIVADFALEFPLLDISRLTEESRDEIARELSRQGSGRGFDLSTGPLIRVMLLKLGEDCHHLLLVLHHIVSDGWSMGVLIREVSELYASIKEGRESLLSPLPIQYVDYSVWQREWLQGEVLEGQLGYWREQLEGVPSLLELPTDRVRPAVQSYAGGHVGFEIGESLTRRLNEISQRNGVTLFMTLLGGFSVLLSKYSGQDDICVGSPIANRSRGELEGLIGFFVNTLVLRTDVGGNPSFEELLGRVKAMTLGAYSHQDVPFERLVDELGVERGHESQSVISGDVCAAECAGGGVREFGVDC